MNLIKQYGCFKLAHFSKIIESSVHQWVMKILLLLAIARRTFNLLWIALYQTFKLKYENSENIKANRVNTVVFNVHQIKRRFLFFFWGGGGGGEGEEIVKCYKIVNNMDYTEFYDSKICSLKRVGHNSNPCIRPLLISDITQMDTCNVLFPRFLVPEEFEMAQAICMKIHRNLFNKRFAKYFHNSSEHHMVLGRKVSHNTFMVKTS